MKAGIVPIIKNKTGDTRDKNNYCLITLVTACSKILELCISLLKITFVHTIISLVLRSSICTVTSVIKNYIRQNSPVYTCFLDASKAFDRITHWTLFKKLIACHTSLLFF